MTDPLVIKVTRGNDSVTLQPVDYTSLLAKGTAGITNPTVVAQLKALTSPTTGGK